LHTTHSDGEYTPAQVVDLARRSGLAAVALTDHDTVGAFDTARAVAGPGLEVIAGVEISAEHEGRELHLLGYFFRPDDPALLTALVRLRQHRAERFRVMAGRLRGLGLSIEEEELDRMDDTTALGRRHLAVLLAESGQVGSPAEAFARYLGDGGPAAVEKVRLPVAEAIALVRSAGGVTSYAHPPAGLTLRALTALRSVGLHAVEAEYPTHRPARSGELRRWAAALGLAVTGGSDCHGPSGPARTVGARGVTARELDELRRLAG
jgi:predicted metal-dependent phosphoesterase TrpH